MAHIADAKFTQGNLMRHVSTMSLTSSIGLMAIFAVDLIDILFISLLGIDELAASAGYASTLMFFASAINIGLSIAAAALVSRAIGAHEEDEARRYATSVAVFTFAVGLAVPVIMLANANYLLGLVGAEGEVAAKAKSYLMIILPTTMFSGMAMVTVAVLRAYGDARRAMYPSLFGGGVNAVLDPLFIFTLGLGLEGAAWATVAARIATMGFALYPAIKKYDAFAMCSLKSVWRDLPKVTGIAIPAVLTNVATPLGSAIVTREMAKYGTEAVAGMAVIGRLVPVVFSVVLALSGAIGPIIGQNFGAARLDRVRESYIDGMKFLTIYVLFAALLLYLVRVPLADMFDAQGDARVLLFWFCGPLALANFFNGAIYVSNASFNNLGHPAYSSWINWGRHTLGTWPFVIVFAGWMGAPGVLVGQAVGGILFAAVAVWLSFRAIEHPGENPFMPFFCPLQYRLHVVSGRCIR
ncbi:MATE family efflux transporter [Roseovarius aestuarii]|uniref:Multidrug export protein MepA n=1 Tax=Roseovarius aestuarii TaxID=475083 RepID=A0A1X7BNX7_9RHOB|nr:MATE family efflux transporter [Roseovarius aestuarii]SMC11220.1 Multidrug export protein MepA [Roseovarius aestuarii]